MGSEDLPPELVAIFLTSLGKAAARLESAMAERDLEDVSFQAHAMRGTCAAYGHAELSRQAGAVEDAADTAQLEVTEAALAIFLASARQLLNDHGGGRP